jgi:hypothetical protein
LGINAVHAGHPYRQCVGYFVRVHGTERDSLEIVFLGVIQGNPIRGGKIETPIAPNAQVLLAYHLFFGVHQFKNNGEVVPAVLEGVKVRYR